MAEIQTLHNMDTTGHEYNSIATTTVTEVSHGNEVSHVGNDVTHVGNDVTHVGNDVNNDVKINIETEHHTTVNGDDNADSGDSDDDMNDTNSTPSSEKKRYKQAFRTKWLYDDQLSEWLIEDRKGTGRGYCIWCKCRITPKLSALRQHAKSRKHKNLRKSLSDSGKMTVDTAGLGPVEVEWQTMQESGGGTHTYKRVKHSSDDYRRQRLFEKAEKCLDQDDDEYDVFGRFVAAKLRKMQKTQSHFAEKQILEIIYNSEMMEYSQYQQESD